MDIVAICLTAIVALVVAYMAYGIGAFLMAFGAPYPGGIAVVVVVAVIVGFLAFIIPLLSFEWVGGACLAGGLIGCWHGRQQLK